ncbi:PREDICTED: protein disulfide-isomerase A5-like [Rhagoletis zephyria]|uniref:protein disulfide-isomerase A5-like n=1 Tax=Rhagoletis zephyria TaxID=28612 RepID=UPI00081121D3|nr:PREDICTED: protein disulfide-isomerase A5-like [Rhagoletis zephyria]
MPPDTRPATTTIIKSDDFLSKFTKTAAQKEKASDAAKLPALPQKHAAGKQAQKESPSPPPKEPKEPKESKVKEEKKSKLASSLASKAKPVEKVEKAEKAAKAEKVEKAEKQVKAAKAKSNEEKSKPDVPDNEECRQTLEDLENIDSETDRHGIIFVKSKDHTVAKDYGITELPALIYFEKRIPSIYQEDISAEEDVLQWLVQQKTEDTIESVNRELLEQLISNTQYLVVYFYKPHCKACDIVLEELENIDDDCEIYGINFVKIQDVNLAKRYGIKNYPALVYFRNGNPLIFDGDLRNEELVFEWLIEDENRELADEIEDVNGRMLEKLINDKPFLAVLFYSKECADCEEAIKSLENIDDEADIFGIDFVKVNDIAANNKYNIQKLPVLAFFRKQQQFMLYEGDLNNEADVLRWLTSNEVFNIKDEIEEVNRKMLEKILEDNDFVAVYFYENDCYDCETILNELEHIDDDTDELEIMFVKIRDTKYARKYGINDVPALVFFRKKFPSIYRGDLIREDEVLEWLKRNRYRHPELNFFMYAITATTGAFVLYTLFLIFCMKKKKGDLKIE